MRVKALLLTALFLLVVSQSTSVIADDFIAYSIDVYTNDLYTFSTDLTNWQYICTFNVLYKLYAGDFIGGDPAWIYAIDYDYGGLYKVSTTTCTVEYIGSTGITTGTASGMTWSAYHGKMFASFTNCATSYLYEVDTATGAATLKGTMTGVACAIDIAADDSGHLYTLDIVTDYIFTVDAATGSTTSLGYAGFSASYAQGMSWDHCTGKLYLAAYNYDTWNAQWRVVNTVTGYSTFIATMSGSEMDCLSFSQDCISLSDTSSTDALLGCSTATNILALPYIGSGSTTYSPYNYISCFSVYSQGDLYKHTAAYTETLSASTCENSYFDTKIYVFTGCNSDGYVSSCIISNDDSCGSQSYVEWSAVAGTTYYIYVTGWGSSTGTYSLNVYSEYDASLDCAYAWQIDSLPYATTGSTVGLNSQYLSCYDINYPGALYSYTPYSDMSLIASTCSDSTNYDSTIFVFIDCNSDGTAICITSDDDSCDLGVQSVAKWDAYAYVTYYILVSGYAGDTGNYYFDLQQNITEVLLDCDAAINILALPYTDSGYTTYSPYNYISCFSVYSQGNLYKYTSSYTETLSASTCENSDFDTEIFIFTGCNNDGYVGSCIASNDQYCGSQSYVEWSAVAGTTYYIYVTGWSAYTGTYSLNVEGAHGVVLLCGSAVEVTYLPFYYTSDTTSAQYQSVSCFFTEYRGHLFQYTATTSQMISATTCGYADFDTYLYVFTGCYGDGYVDECIASNDDGDYECDLKSTVEWIATSGVTYYIYVTGYDGETGSYELEIDETDLDAEFDAYVIDDSNSLSHFTNRAASDYSTICYIDYSYYIYAGAFADDETDSMYVVDIMLGDVYEMDMDDCEMDYIATAPSYGYVTGMTWSDSDQVFYLVENDGYSSYFLSFDVDSETFTFLYQINGCFVVDIAVDAYDDIYGLDLLNYALLYIDLDEWEYYSVDYLDTLLDFASMEYDPCTDKMYIANGYELYTFDLYYGYFEHVSTLPFYVNALAFGSSCELVDDSSYESSDDDDDDDDDDSVGVIVGAVIGGTAAVMLGAGAAFAVVAARKNKHRKEEPTEPVHLSNLEDVPDVPDATPTTTTVVEVMSVPGQPSVAPGNVDGVPPSDMCGGGGGGEVPFAGGAAYPQPYAPYPYPAAAYPPPEQMYAQPVYTPQQAAYQQWPAPIVQPTDPTQPNM